MNKPDYLISTPENVDLHLELAGLGNRILAAFIDHAIIGGIVIVIIINLALAAWTTDKSAFPSETQNIIYMVLVGVGLLLIFFTNFGYFVLFEGIWRGQTPGKRATGIRVIEDNGQPVGWPAVFIRNLLRPIDEIPLFYPGILPMLIDKNERRLGDFAAGTLVIKERLPMLNASELQLVSGAAHDYHFDFGQLSAPEYNLLTAFLKRRQLLAAPERQRLAADLATHLTQTLALTEQNDPPELFLEKVYNGYVQRSQGDAYSADNS